MRGKVLFRVTFALTAIGFVASTAWSAQSKKVVRPQVFQSQVDVPVPVKHVHTRATREVTTAPPANDNCANAIAIPSTPYTTAVDTTEATDEAGEPASICTTQSNSVWYTYVNPLPNPQSVTVDTFTSDFDTALQVLTGSCGSLTAIACNDDGGGTTGFESTITFLAAPGVIYHIQAGGFGGDTGNLVFHANATGGNCAPTNVARNLGTAPVTGTQTGRLFRNGVASSCAVPKTCTTFDAIPGRTYDAYTIPNLSGADQCMTVTLTTAAGCGTGSGMQANAYLNTYNPAAICTNYLADPGLSTGGGGGTITMSFTLPAGNSAVIVVHEIDAATSAGCPYTLSVAGDTCTSIPTLSRSGMVALALLLLGAAIVVLRFRN